MQIRRAHALGSKCAYPNRHSAYDISLFDLFFSRLHVPDLRCWRSTSQHAMSGTTMTDVRSRSSSNVKRKYSDHDSCEAIGEPFSIAVSSTKLQSPPKLTICVQYDSSSPLQRLTLTPRRLVPRHTLPLAYLDLTRSPNDPQPPKLFTANARALTPLLTEPYFLSDPRVLIAESRESGTLYATEGIRNGVQGGVYALCRLASWVSLEDFGRSEAKVRRLKAPQHVSEPGHWWSHAAVDTIEGVASKSGVLNPTKMSSILKTPGADSLITPELQEPTAGPQNIKGNREDLIPTPEPSAEDWQEANAHDVLALFRDHYFEALYMSKMSLAFFAKGPLSRARAVCAASGEAGTNIAQLMDTLRAATYKVSLFDEKYHETLPELIEEIPPHLLAEDDDAIVMREFANKIKKSRKRKKISKDGLAPGEEEYVIRWWTKHESHASPETLSADKKTWIRDALSEQKVREIQLQILLILEVFALEAMELERKKDNDTHTRPIAENDLPCPKPTLEKRPKDVEKRHTLLGLLVDKLCIWDSMSLEDFGLPDLATKAPKVKQGTSNSSTERLRNFCTEVIIPL